MHLYGWSDYSRIAVLQVVIDCISQLPTLTALRLKLAELPQGSVTLQPLLQLTRLQTLQLSGMYSLNAVDCSVFTQLGSLSHLNLSQVRVPLEALQTLCTPPHQQSGLSWLELGSSTVTAAHMEALLLLPALSSLSIATDAAAAAVLPHVRSLRSLDLWMKGQAPSECLPHLALCNQLTSLTVQWCRLEPSDLVELGRSLTSLTALRFRWVKFGERYRPNVFACLQSFSQLRELQLYQCLRVGLVHLVDDAFTSLPSLRSLTVSLPRSDLSVANSIFKIPSKIMPQLIRATLTDIEDDARDYSAD